MGWLKTVGKGVLGAGAGVIAVTALPIFGAVGAATAVGLVVCGTTGAAAGMLAPDEAVEAATKTALVGATTVAAKSMQQKQIGNKNS